MCRLTSQHHPAKQSVVPLQRAAVPAVMSELVLALFDPLFGSLSDGLHQVGVLLAELLLLVHQDVVADHPSPQRPDVPANTASTVVSVTSGRHTSIIFLHQEHVKVYHLASVKLVNVFCGFGAVFSWSDKITLDDVIRVVLAFSTATFTCQQSGVSGKIFHNSSITHSAYYVVTLII